MANRQERKEVSASKKWRSDDLIGVNFLVVHRIQPAAKRMNEGRRNRNGRDQTAADHENYGSHDKVVEGKRHN